MKVLCVSGFLGAGKTTFIERMLKVLPANLKTTVLENEYAETNMDEKQLASKTSVYQLSEGCICCTKRSGFAETVMVISNTVNPDLLIVEPTGIGSLSAVLENIGKVEYFRIVQLGAVAVVDPKALELYMSRYEELFRDQIANSSSVYLAARPNTDEALVEKARSCVRGINAEAQIVEGPLEDLNMEFFQSLLERKRLKGVIKGGSVHHDIESFKLDNVHFDEVSDLNMKMRAVMEGRFGQVVRVKGSVTLNGSAYKIDIAGMNLTMTPVNDGLFDNSMVVIGQQLDKDSLSLLLLS